MALPEKIMSNHDLAKIVETSDDWIQTRTGIAERRIAAEGETTSDLATAAGRQALQNAGLQPTDLDLIILATISGDVPFPATACYTQAKLGAPQAAAFDISAACSGYVYGLSVADGFIRSGMYRNILVIGAETMTRTLNWQDRGTCILFGDGAGATVVLASEKPGIIDTVLGTDGQIADLLYIPAGASRLPASEETVAQNQHFTVMDGREIFKHGVRHAEEVAVRILEKNNVAFEDIDLLIPHQANERITESVRNRLGLPKEKVVSNISRYGNTSGATIPICLHEAQQEGRLKSGDLILLVGFGAGFTWASALIRW